MTNRILTDRIESPIGELLAGATSGGVCLLEFLGDTRAESQLEAVWRALGAEEHAGAGADGARAAAEHLARLARELDGYFAGTLSRFETPLVMAGTPFQRRVWDALLAIPYGETRCYEDLAITIGSEHGQRAVGHANGDNRIAIVIPCHRVVNKNGQLGGYGGGLWRKEFLLELEGGRPKSLIARPRGKAR
ncbi:MAG: methylated-DNA--[protein]-cysteine S-methyltransferase [bacterium]